MSSVSSSSLVSSSFSSWASVVYVVCSCVVGWVVVVVLAEVVGRAGCLGLLLMKSAFRSIPLRAVFRRSEPHHVARQIVVVSVGSVCS